MCRGNWTGIGLDGTGLGSSALYISFVVLFSLSWIIGLVMVGSYQIGWKFSLCWTTKNIDRTFLQKIESPFTREFGIYDV